MENHLSLATSTTDIYIKKMPNKLAGVIFRTKRAVKIARENNVRNMYEGERDYRFDISALQTIKILTWAMSHRLSIDTEVEMIVEDKSAELRQRRLQERKDKFN
jgi:hypothetical protein